MMIDVFLFLLQVSGLFVLAVGMLTVFSWCLPLKKPADTSNRFNRLRLWWFAVKCPEIFDFNWMQKDERDILK